MPRYFRGKRNEDPSGGGTEATYFAVGEKLKFDVNDDIGEGYPVGEVGVKYTPAKDTPVFYNGDSASLRGTIYKKLAKETGFHPQHIENIHKALLANPTDENIDLSIALSRTTDIDFDTQSRLLHQAMGRAQQPDDAGNRGTNRDMWVQEARLRGIDQAKDVSFIKNHPHMNPYQLFTSTEPSLRVHFANFDPSVSVAFPSTVALASNDFDTRNIVADSDLSPQSSKLAQHAAKKGLVTGHTNNPQMKVTNSMGWSSYLARPDDIDKTLAQGTGSVETTGWTHPMSAVSDSDAKKARMTLRDMLRKPESSPKLSTQFEHLRLPGTEGFDD